jgi:hypothetical protein
METCGSKDTDKSFSLDVEGVMIRPLLEQVCKVKDSSPSEPDLFLIQGFNFRLEDIVPKTGDDEGLEEY